MNTSSIQQLKTEGVFNMPYPPEVRSAVINAVASWRAFCALPEMTKKSLPYSNDGAGVGYEMKDGSGIKGDRKENFDIAASGKQWLEIVQIADPTSRLFVHDAENLIEASRSLVMNFAEAAEKGLGLNGFAHEVRESADTIFVRFIHYFEGQDVGAELASTHPDQSGFTLHLFESDPGLQRFTFDGKWVDMPVSEKETAIIPAMQLQLRSKGELKAVSHRVIATETTSRTGRFSVVCFVQLKRTLKYDKKKCGRLQEMVQAKGDGFNYSMGHEEFTRLFMK